VTFSFASFRKKWPLPVQMGYGWLKRKYAPRTFWDDPDFIRSYEWLMQTQWWSKTQLEALQLEKLRALIIHAYENVPYYRCVFDGLHLKPSDFNSLADLRKLPFLTKEDVRNNFEDLIARNISRKRLRYETTGGSTGTPLGIYWDRDTSDVQEAAFMLRQWSWAGYRRGDRVVKLRGAHSDRMSKQGWEYDTDENTLKLLGLDMNEDIMQIYVEKIGQFRPRFILSYPSLLEILARFMKRNDIVAHGVSAIFCQSETLYSVQRKLIEEQFSSKIFSEYGLTERSADAVECQEHQGYHVSMEYGILELIGKDGPITQPGAIGKVVGTGFDTYCMPMIRYETDDLASYATHECDCGRHLTLIENFQGRLREFLVSKKGQLVPFGPLYSTITYESQIWGEVSEIAFIQEKEGELLVKVVPSSSSLSSDLLRGISSNFYKWLDEGEFDVKVSIVDDIRRKGRGKLSLLDQRLPIMLDDLESMESYFDWV